MRLQRLRSFNFKNTKYFLKASAEPILRAFRIPQVALTEFPRGKPTIVDWANTLISHYAAYDDVDSHARHDRLSTLTVKELRWYRGAKGREHEYVVAIIADPQCGCERFIRLERMRDDPGVDEIPFPKTKYSRYARSSVSLSSSRSSLSFYDEPDDIGIGCFDAIRVLRELPRFDRIVEETVFRDSHGEYWAPTLLDLALVARVVHENNNYHMWPRQCGWFSTVIVRVMQSKFLHQIVHRDLALSLQSDMIGALENSSGSDKTHEILKEQDQVIYDIALAYRAIRDDVAIQIEDAMYRVQRYKEQHIIIDEAVAQRDEAAALAAAATASSVEATARAAEAAARAAEAEARAEREAQLREEAEERAHDEAQRYAVSERELRDLRRRLEELEASSPNRRTKRDTWKPLVCIPHH